MLFDISVLTTDVNNSKERHIHGQEKNGGLCYFLTAMHLRICAVSLNFKGQIKIKIA